MVRNKLTGAHYGLSSWLQQRITAVVMLVIAIIFIIFVAVMALDINSDISSWQMVFHYVWVKLFVQVFFIAVLLHAWVGIRDIWMDYFSCVALKLTLYVLTFLWLIGSLTYSIKIIWM